MKTFTQFLAALKEEFWKGESGRYGDYLEVYKTPLVPNYENSHTAKDTIKSVESFRGKLCTLGTAKPENMLT